MPKVQHCFCLFVNNQQTKQIVSKVNEKIQIAESSDP